VAKETAAEAEETAAAAMESRGSKVGADLSGTRSTAVACGQHRVAKRVGARVFQPATSRRRHPWGVQQGFNCSVAVAVYVRTPA
jgi:hypothetical protein